MNYIENAFLVGASAALGVLATRAYLRLRAPKERKKADDRVILSDMKIEVLRRYNRFIHTWLLCDDVTLRKQQASYLLGYDLHKQVAASVTVWELCCLESRFYKDIEDSLSNGVFIPPKPRSNQGANVSNTETLSSLAAQSPASPLGGMFYVKTRAEREIPLPPFDNYAVPKLD